MTVVLTHGWNGLRVGQELNLSDGMANVLIRRGFATVIEPKPQQKQIDHNLNGKRRRG